MSIGSKKPIGGSQQLQDAVDYLMQGIAEIGPILQAEMTKLIEKIKRRPIEDHVLTVGCCFVVAVFFRWLGLRNDESVISVVLLFNVIFFSAATAIVETVQSGTIHQYSAAVLLFSILHLFSLLHTNALFVGLFPLLIIFLKQKLIKTAKKAH